ncbi:MAG: hypothetical protein ABL867_10410, partial [Rickettsiales bacterium]
ALSEQTSKSLDVLVRRNKVEFTIAPPKSSEESCVTCSNKKAEEFMQQYGMVAKNAPSHYWRNEITEQMYVPNGKTHNTKYR